MPKEFRNGINVDSGGANPTVQQEGDFWYRDDLHRMWFRNDTGNCEVLGHLTNFNTSASVQTTAKTGVVSAALTTGYYRFKAEIDVSANTGTLTTTLDFTGTSGAGLSWSQIAWIGSTSTKSNVMTATGVASSTLTGIGHRLIYGTIGITVAGTITISFTAGTSFTVPALGAYFDAYRIG